MFRTAHRVACLLTVAGVCDLSAQAPRKNDPKVTSIAPFGMQRGGTQAAVIRGTNLGEARSLWFRDQGISARVVRMEPEKAAMPAASSGPEKSTPIQLLHVEISIADTVKPALEAFRVVTSNGMSNEVKIRISEEAVVAEADAPETITRFPALVNGSVTQHGESDQYCLQASDQQQLKFHVFTENSSFDPVVSLYESSGSWFDAKRQNFIASNDEPVDFPGMPRDSILVHRFNRAGRYCVRVEGFTGRGGADSQYQLHITPFEGPEPSRRPAPAETWDERRATRVLSNDWIEKVAVRGDNPSVPPPPEIYRAVPEGSPEVPVMKAPGFVQGAITRPGDCHVIRLNVEKPQDLVIEIETPEATAPSFNPIVRLLEPGGDEIVTNVYTRLNNNNLKAFKAIQSKVTFDLQAPGIYTMQIRDLTTDSAREDFKYRVLVRQQIPHVGRFAVSQEYVNLIAGATRNLTLTADREEDFKGTLAFSVENLPTGVTAVTGLENPDERPALPNAGKRERYRPSPQTASILLVAAAEAPALERPAMIRIVSRLIMNGKLGEPVATVEIPIMVIARRAS